MLRLPAPDPGSTRNVKGYCDKDLFPDIRLNDPVEPVYCVCRKPDDGQMMIACDACYEWFHVKCMNLSVVEAEQLDYFICPACRCLGEQC